MSRIIVNGDYVIEGKFSFDVSYDRNSSPQLVNINGVLTSSSGYMPDIRQLENDRYRLTGIFVYKEAYGSEEDEMAYYFAAKSYAMADSLQEVKIVNG